jgi:hypothetical protein
MQQVIQRGPIFNTPTVRWLGGKQRVTVHYVAFSTPIPLKYGGVEDVVLRDDSIVITERHTHREMILKSGKRW